MSVFVGAQMNGSASVAQGSSGSPTVPESVVEELKAAHTRSLNKILADSKSMMASKAGFISRLKEQLDSINKKSLENERDMTAELRKLEEESSKLCEEIARTRSMEGTSMAAKVEQIRQNNEDALAAVTKECEQRIAEVKKWAKAHIDSIQHEKETALTQMDKQLEEAREKERISTEQLQAPYANDMQLLRNQLAELMRRGTQLEQSMSTEQAEHNRGVASLHSEIRDAEEELADLKRQVDTNSQRLHRQMRSGDSQVDNAIRQRKATFVARKAHLLSRQKELEGQIAESKALMQQQVEAAAQDVQTLTSKFTESQALAEALEKTKESAIQQCSSLDDRIATLSEERNQLRRLKRQLITSNERLRIETERVDRILMHNVKARESGSALITKLFESSSSVPGSRVSSAVPDISSSSSLRLGNSKNPVGGVM